MTEREGGAAGGNKQDNPRILSQYDAHWLFLAQKASRTFITSSSCCCLPMMVSSLLRVASCRTLSRSCSSSPCLALCSASRWAACVAEMWAASLCLKASRAMLQGVGVQHKHICAAVRAAPPPASPPTTVTRGCLPLIHFLHLSQLCLQSLCLLGCWPASLCRSQCTELSLGIHTCGACLL